MLYNNLISTQWVVFILWSIYNKLFKLKLVLAYSILCLSLTTDKKQYGGNSLAAEQINDLK